MLIWKKHVLKPLFILKSNCYNLLKPKTQAGNYGDNWEIWVCNNS